ncbi:hypothetical protein G7Y89_g12441 [Cudoniella acicularis]|uniref:Steroid 5-alpha reductase C-terminal domain-containing protein n=1 Tax=Cudoniella acicularis TaxID=354080 RepID=A0A8H4VZN1_9HELO|nr:hypothetical protein G7Y89_g12441 [Cudoniella acicularis]
MALPVVKTLADCSIFDKTVLPYLPQLYDLPQQILQSWNNPAEFQALYLATNPLVTAFAFSLFLAPLFLVISEINKNYSQVDRMWSILPTIYNAHYVAYTHMSGLPTQRLDNLIAFSCVWSGGSKKAHQPTAFLPIQRHLHLSRTKSLAIPHYYAHICDDYQEAKKSYQKIAKVPHKYEQEDLDRGFIVTGLWSYSRHPNFAAEQAIWVILYQWGCWTSEVMYNWTFAGALAYLFLFQASTWFTELITAGKYPDYKEYQNRVGKFLPKLTSSLPGDFSDQKAKPKVEKPSSAKAKNGGIRN